MAGSDGKKGMSAQNIIGLEDDHEDHPTIPDDNHDTTLIDPVSSCSLHPAKSKQRASTHALSAQETATPTTSSAPRGKATLQDLTSQAKTAMEGGCRAEDIEAAKILVEISAGDWGSGETTAANSDMSPRMNKPALDEPTVKDMEKAVAHVNRVYGVSLSLGDLRVALMLSDMRNGTETEIGEALKGWY